MTTTAWFTTIGGSLLLFAFAGCSGSGDTGPITSTATTSAAVCGPTGVTVPIEVRAAAGANSSVSFAGSPSTVVVSPAATLTDSSGAATAYAFVPYGTRGSVIASALGATPASIDVSAGPVLLGQPSLTKSDLNGAGQFYEVSILATSDGGTVAGRSLPCDSGTKVTGLPVTVALVPAGSSSVGSTSGSGSSSSTSTTGGTGSGAGSTSNAITDDDGNAQARVFVPWGANAIVQASGGDGYSWENLHQISNPATVSCLSWSQNSDDKTYTVTAVINASGDSMLAMAAVPVSFSVVYPTQSTTAMAAPVLIAPATAPTNSTGHAQTIVALEFSGATSTTPAGPTTPPIVVEAVAASSVLTVEIGSGSSSAPCP